MLKRSGNLLHFPFWDHGYRKLLELGVLFLFLAGAFLFIGLPFWQAGQIQASPFLFAGLALAVLLSPLFGLVYLGIKAQRKVWLDLGNGTVVIGSRKHGSRYDANQFQSVHSRVETRLTRGGRRILDRLSVELHGVDGNLEIARFSNARFAINNWTDHAQAQLLRGLIAEHWGLKDDGVLGKTFPQLLADDQASLEQSFKTQILPKAADKWIRRGLKLGLFVLASPVIAGGLYALYSGRLTLGDLKMLFGIGVFLTLCWLAFDLVGNGAGIRRKMAQASAGIAIACAAMVLMQLFGASHLDWGNLLFYSGAGISALAYWLRHRFVSKRA